MPSFMTLPQAGQALMRKPAWVLSRIILRSNSASAANTWSINLPVTLRVSIFSVRLSKKTPLFYRSVIIFTRSERDRPKRSRRHTINVSPERRALRH